MSPKSSNGSRRPTGRLLSIAAVAISCAVAAVLVATAVTRDSGGQTETVGPVAPSSLVTEPSIPIDSVPASELGPSTRLLTVVNSRSAWRTAVGPCPVSNAVIESTSDGGATWDGFDLGTAGGVSTAVTLFATDDLQSVQLVALDRAACQPTWIETSDAGGEWTAFPDRLSQGWFVDPANRAAVTSPSGFRTAPCDAVVSLATEDTTTAAVLCSDRSLFRTVDGGATWTPLPAVSGASALGAGGGEFLVVSEPSEITCTGVVVNRVSATATEPIGPWTTTDCIANRVISDDIAVGASSDSMWLWIGSSIVRSVDGGRTWN